MIQFCYKRVAILNLVQYFAETEAWLLLTFFICFHNQLMYNQYVITFHCHKLKGTNGELSKRQKMNGCSFQHVLRQNLRFNTRKRVFLEVSF